MARKRYKPEEIVAKLRQDVLVSQGQNMGGCRPGGEKRTQPAPRAAAGGGAARWRYG